MSALPAKRQTRTVGEVCDQWGGDVQTGPFGSQLHADDYSLSGVPVVMPQDLRSGSIATEKIARIPESVARRLSRHRLQRGDIVLSRRGDLTRFAVIDSGEEGWICGTGSIRIRTNSPELETRYLRHYFRQRAVGEWLAHHAKGVTMPNLNTTSIRALPLLQPTLAEQRRIVEVLDKADELRAKRRAALAQLDTLSQSIFLDMFGDPAINPKAWPTRSLGSVALKFSDGPFGSNLKTQHYSDSGVRVVRLQNVGIGMFLDVNSAFIPVEHFNKLRKHECVPGDVIIATLGDPNLRACVLPPSIPVALNKADCVQMRPDKSQTNSEYLCAVLNHPSTLKLAQDLMHGQTRVRISMGQLRLLQIPVPPRQLQGEFARRTSRVNALRTAHEDSYSQLNTLFASLQHRAFRDEL